MSTAQDLHPFKMPKQRIYRCRHCHHTTDNKVDSWQHIKLHVRPEKLLHCTSCPFVTEYKHHYEYHQRNHDGYKPYKCDECGYQCVNNSMLKSHLKSHSPVYPYQCGDCKYATKYIHSLRMHLKKYNHRDLCNDRDENEPKQQQHQQQPQQQQPPQLQHEQPCVLDLRVESKLK